MLGFGIGASTSIYSLANALLVRLLPFPEPERIVVVSATHPSRGRTSVGPDDFRDWKSRNTVFEEMAYTMGSYVTLTGRGKDPERLAGAEVSDGFFSLLDVQPALGRWFLNQEQKPGENRVVILGHGLWQRRFGGDPSVVGQSLVLNGQPHTVVGVMPRGFRFNEQRMCEFWRPLAHFAAGRQIHQYHAYARLKDGVSLTAAHDQMSAIARQLEEEHPATNTGWGIHLIGLRDALLEVVGGPLLVFSAAVGLMLLIACANVANLLMARTAGRSSEIALRRALGAGRARIVRLLLIESVLLAGAAAGVGLLLTLWAKGVITAAAPSYLELDSILYIAPSVLGFALALAFLTAMLTGLHPALVASGASLTGSLGQTGGPTGSNRTRTMSATVIAEVALCMVLLVAAGLLTKSFVRLLQVDLGFQAGEVVTARVSLPRSRYAEPCQRTAFADSLLNRVRRLPGL
ncbi:MAG: FtsX-like permease family protein, partial [bacterium]|nr:FtsX-like permease family protein [bacterium]